MGPKTKKETTLPHFKLPLIVTGIVVVLVVVAGIGGIVYIDKNSESDQEKKLGEKGLGRVLGPLPTF